MGPFKCAGGIPLHVLAGWEGGACAEAALEADL